MRERARMQGATLEELRDLSRRSRRAHRAGILSLVGALLLVPLALVAPVAWAPYAAVVAGGMILLRYAHVAGQERGAFRKVFARIKEDRLARTLVPKGPEKESEAPLTA